MEGLELVVLGRSKNDNAPQQSNTKLNLLKIFENINRITVHRFDCQ